MSLTTRSLKRRCAAGLAFAARHHLSSIAQLKPLAASMVFGAPPEFKTRADGQAGLRKRYGLQFKGFDPLDESGPITLKALTDGQVQAADPMVLVLSRGAFCPKDREQHRLLVQMEPELKGPASSSTRSITAIGTGGGHHPPSCART